MQPRRHEDAGRITAPLNGHSYSCLRVFGVVSLWLACYAIQSSAQAPAAPNDGKREFTISGCLLRNGYAGYQVDTARVEAIDGKAIASSPGAAAASAPEMPKKWILDGGGNLGASTGKKVEVTGRTEWQPPSSSTADEPPDRTPHLDVKSVKTIAPTCS